MKVAADRSELVGATLYAFAPGESPIPGLVLRTTLGQNDLGESYLAEDGASRPFLLRRLVRTIPLSESTSVRGRPSPHLVPHRIVQASPRGETWLVRDYLSGHSLSDVLSARPAGMPFKEALRWVRGIAAGLQAIERDGGVHGRLKPNNVWLEKGVVRLVDYGLPPSTAAHGACVGRETRFAAPETAAGRFDMANSYALAAVLVEMLTGRELTADAAWQEWLAEPYGLILSRALDPIPAYRWKSLDELLDALEAAPPDLPLHAPVDGPRAVGATPFAFLTPAERSDASDRVLWAMLAVGLVVLALACSTMQSSAMAIASGATPSWRGAR